MRTAVFSLGSQIWDKPGPNVKFRQFLFPRSSVRIANPSSVSAEGRRSSQEGSNHTVAQSSLRSQGAAPHANFTVRLRDYTASECKQNHRLSVVVFCAVPHPLHTRTLVRQHGYWCFDINKL